MEYTPKIVALLFGFTAGTILHLFLLLLILGQRRPRAFERILFWFFFAAFLWNAGLLLFFNAQLEESSVGTARFSLLVSFFGLALIPPTLLHLHCEHYRILSGGRRRWPLWLGLMGYTPLAYVLPQGMAFLRESPTPHAVASTFQMVWVTAALAAAAVFQWRFARGATDRFLRRFHRFLTGYFLLAVMCLVYLISVGRTGWSTGWMPMLLSLSPLVPNSALSYFILRQNFLGIGVQRNLVYAVTGGFLAVLYLTLVQRVAAWLAPWFPPVATSSILVFVLVFLFEPLQRRLGALLRQVLRGEAEKLQRLTAEIQQVARTGSVAELLQFSERRIGEALSLPQVRILLAGQPARPPGLAAHLERFPLRRDDEQIGLLEACYFGPALSGENFAALEYIAEQLPAALDLCRLIEEKVRLERELAGRERLALVGQMAASISHNLRNPLGSMKTLLELQLENPELPESARGDCRRLLDEIDRLSAKLTQLLRFSRPALRPDAEGRGQFDARAAAENIVGLLQHDAARRGIELRLSAAGERVPAAGTEEAFGDVLSNLIVNAVEALPPGGAVEVALAPVAGGAGEYSLTVTDDGPGIPPDVRARMFQPFFSTKPSGTGLGLAIVARRVNEMGGGVRCESPVADGRGTRFVVTLRAPEQAEHR